VICKTLFKTNHQLNQRPPKNIFLGLGVTKHAAGGVSLDQVARAVNTVFFTAQRKSCTPAVAQ
jgi:hypothetical protein